MSGRIEQTSVHFKSPFRLTGIEHELPAGEYRVDHLWELIEGLTHAAYRRTQSLIHLPAVGTRSLIQQTYTIEPSDMNTVIAKDGAS